MAFIYAMTDLWNDVLITFTAIKMNVTDTNSAASSLLMDLQIGSSTRAKITKQGGICGTSFNGASGGFSQVRFAGNSEQVGGDASNGACTDGVGFTVRSGNGYHWVNNSDSEVIANIDLSLVRDTTDILAQRRAANAQELRVYNVFTTVSNSEYLGISFKTSANKCILGPQAGVDGGTLRAMQVNYNITTVASLPSPAAAIRGAQMYVSDANLPVIYTTVSSGGAVVIPVFCNGSNWICG